MRNLNQSLVAGAAWSWPRVGTISTILYNVVRLQLVVVRNLNQSLVAGAAWSWLMVGTISTILYNI